MGIPPAATLTRFTELYALAIAAKRLRPMLLERARGDEMNDQPRSSWTKRSFALSAVALGLIGLGAAGVAAARPGLFGHGFGHLRHHGGAHDAEDVRFAVAWVLREVDASEAQVARVSEIATRAVADLEALRDLHRARHDAFTAALVTGDRGALEALRRESLASLEGASQRVVAALADAAEVLTPEQRQRLADAHAARHGADE
jgi:Spy/CpxP family protein refolding chaperone